MSRKKIDPLVLCSVVGYCFAFFMFGLQVNLLGPTATVLAHKLGVVEPDLGVIFTINGLTSIIGAMPSGSLIDKLPGHAVLAAALAFEVGVGGGHWPTCTPQSRCSTAVSPVMCSC